MNLTMLMDIEQAPKGEYLIQGKGLQATLLILTRMLHGASLLDNTGAHSPE